MPEFFAATEHEPLELTADRIRKLRRALGLTQVELAQRVGVSEDTVRNWENDRTRPGSVQAVIELVRALGPQPVPGKTLLLPPRAVELSEDRTLAVVNRRGRPPVVYFTKMYPIAQP